MHHSEVPSDPGMLLIYAAIALVVAAVMLSGKIRDHRAVQQTREKFKRNASILDPP